MSDPCGENNKDRIPGIAGGRGRTEEGQTALSLPVVS